VWRRNIIAPLSQINRKPKDTFGRFMKVGRTQFIHGILLLLVELSERVVGAITINPKADNTAPSRLFREKHRSKTRTFSSSAAAVVRRRLVVTSKQLTVTRTDLCSCDRNRHFYSVEQQQAAATTRARIEHGIPNEQKKECCHRSSTIIGCGGGATVLSGGIREYHGSDPAATVAAAAGTAAARNQRDPGSEELGGGAEGSHL
jgi:hypothetical protein